MKVLLLSLSIFLTACTTVVPVTQKFPAGPGEPINQPCPDLKQLTGEAKLSDVARTVVDNYTLYHECSLRTKTWIDWYTKQKEIFEGLKK
jgi:hypothetical protein